MLIQPWRLQAGTQPSRTALRLSLDVRFWLAQRGCRLCWHSGWHGRRTAILG
jgi:hypothetical protein